MENGQQGASPDTNSHAARAPRRRLVRWILRGSVLGVAVAFAVQILPWRETAAFFPRLSPFLAICSTIAARHAGAGAVLLALPILLLALLKGRWFCGNICPTGTLADAAGRLRTGARSLFCRWPRLGYILAAIGFGSAVAGYPLFLWMDPLSLFNGFFSAIRNPVTVATLAPAAGLLIVLLLSFYRPRLWCTRLCPLGATQDMLGSIGRFAKNRLSQHKPAGAIQTAIPSHNSTSIGRRFFITAVVGWVAAVALRCVRRTSYEKCIRPPGAVDESLFLGLCARCGNCIRACRYGIIHFDHGSSGMLGIGTPVIRMSPGYCNEWCNECGKVCPVGAIRPLKIEEKRNISIGTAVVDKSRCIAWSQAQYCMVCQEFCPYTAVGSVENRGVSCPVVDEEICRGCGACESHCPALPDKAITVHGIPQRLAKPIST